MQLHEIPHIKLNAEISVNKPIIDNELKNYFRLFKQTEENLEDDCVYSPLFDAPNLFVLGNDYADRMYLYNVLQIKLPDRCTKLYLSYDFSYAPINNAYTTDGEYSFVGTFLDKLLMQTNLSLLLFVSHFNQIGNKAKTYLKPEHFHGLIGGNTSDVEQFVKLLKVEKIINKVIVKE